MKYIVVRIWKSQMSGFPGIANAGLTYESPENMARWQHFTVSFCLLRGLNSSLSGDVLSCDVLQILPVLHLGSSVRFPQWENPIESTQHGNLTISFWTILWNLISILFVLQNCNMLKPHITFYLALNPTESSDSSLYQIPWDFCLYYPDLMYTEEMDCKARPFVRKGWFPPSPGYIQKDLTNNSYLFSWITVAGCERRSSECRAS